jgi:peroxiredoxin/tetratricopeptide (TPR) repeat protein
VLAATLWGVSPARADEPVKRGDEPNKPTASPTEANPAVPAAGHSVHGETFDDGPRHAAYLMPGMGKASFPVTTDKPDAQAFINQGVGQLHSFFYFEAERSFRQASTIDPGCAMAYWGMAMANVNNPKRAKGFLKEARKRDGKLTRREKLYVDALEALHKEGGTSASRLKDHLAALEVIVQEFPGDIDARAWMAMVTWQVGGITSRQAVDTVIETVMNVEPMHPGSHHYRIHLWDGVKPARAERSAAVYGKTAPGIAHAWHMPGHTYTGLQRYADAAYQQEASARVDHAYMIRDRVMPFEIHNYAHNNQWLVTSLSHVGRARDGIIVARNLAEQPRDPNRNGKNDGGSPQRLGRLRWSEVLTRYEFWDDLLAATRSGALDWSDVPVERKQKAYALGLAYAAKGDAAKLAEQVAALKAVKGVSVDAAVAELEGYQLLARGEVGRAFERFAKATDMRPEALARAHLSARNYGFAESAARDAVKKQPKQVPPLAALVEILHAVGKTKDAQEAYQQLAPLAKGADPDTPVFRRLAAILDGWKADGWVPPAEPPTDELTTGRVDLATLGPLAWSPSPAEPFSRTDTAGASWDLAAHKGRNVVVLFFLGGKCAHCMQQLQVFGAEVGALKAINTDLVAVGTDDLASSKALKENADGVKFPFPMLPDPSLEVFKRYRAYDDFEGAPLHGTFLIDAAGNVRFQRISAEPFLDVDFIKAESARVTRMLK